MLSKELIISGIPLNPTEGGFCMKEGDGRYKFENIFLSLTPYFHGVDNPLSLLCFLFHIASNGGGNRRVACEAQEEHVKCYPNFIASF